jgi:hypothetical protein
MIAVLERAKTIRALDRSATAIGTREMDVKIYTTNLTNKPSPRIYEGSVKPYKEASNTVSYYSIVRTVYNLPFPEVSVWGTVSDTGGGGGCMWIFFVNALEISRWHLTAFKTDYSPKIVLSAMFSVNVFSVLYTT